MKFKKRFKKISILLFVMLLTLITVITPVYAIESEQKYFNLTIENMSQNEIINDELYIFFNDYAILDEFGYIQNLYNNEIIYNDISYNSYEIKYYYSLDVYEIFMIQDAQINVFTDYVLFLDWTADFPQMVSNGDTFVFILEVEKVPSVSILQGFVNVAEKVYLDLLPIMGQGLVVGFNALAVVTVGEVTTPTNLVLVLFMWTLLLIAVGAIGKAFGVLRGSRK